jgi:succinyl-diaminopimelate desuccinylase
VADNVSDGGSRPTLALMDVTELLELAAELIGIESTADRPGELRRALGLVLGAIGPGFAVDHYESGGKPSALVHPAGSTGPYRLILNAHLDVVPGAPDQFRARRDGDRLYGRGAQDMKVAALVMAEVFREVAADLAYPIGLQLVTDEEVGGYDGTDHQLGRGVRADFVVIGEHSGLRVVHESKGIAQVRLVATGVAAHAAYPWLGSNALTLLTRAVDRVLDRYPVPAAEAWATTVNVARIETGNRAFNQVPAEATAWLDIRFPSGDSDLTGRSKDEVAAHLSELAGVPVEVDSLGAPHYADPGRPEVDLLRKAGKPELLRKHGSADGRFYSARGIDAVIFGPGGDGQHGPGEYLDVTTVEPYRAALTALARGL